MTILSKATYRFDVIPIKISVTLFRELEQMIWNFYGNTKESEEPKQSWERKKEMPYYQIDYGNAELKKPDI